MGTNDRIIDEIRRYTDPYSLLAIYGKKLIRIRCPFRVMLMIDYAGKKKGEVMSVDKIMLTPDLRMVYIINGEGFLASCFRILLF
jgi:hypothetical protein